MKRVVNFTAAERARRPLILFDVDDHEYMDAFVRNFSL